MFIIFRFKREYGCTSAVSLNACLLIQAAKWLQTEPRQLRGNSDASSQPASITGRLWQTSTAQMLDCSSLIILFLLNDSVTSPVSVALKKHWKSWGQYSRLKNPQLDSLIIRNYVSWRYLENKQVILTSSHNSTTQVVGASQIWKHPVIKQTYEYCIGQDTVSALQSCTQIYLSATVELL